MPNTDGGNFPDVSAVVLRASPGKMPEPSGDAACPPIIAHSTKTAMGRHRLLKLTTIALAGAVALPEVAEPGRHATGQKGKQSCN